MRFYSTTAFREAAFSLFYALPGSFGFGVINFIFAFPAFWTLCLLCDGDVYQVPGHRSGAVVVQPVGVTAESAQLGPLIEEEDGPERIS